MAGVGSEDRLQQYFDGELADGEAAALRAKLESDEELRAKLEGLAHLRKLMVAGAQDRGDEVDSDALFGAISARLGNAAAEDDDPMLPLDEAEPATARPPLAVVPGGKKAEPAQPKAKPRRNVAWIGIAATLAVAAAVLLFVLRPFDFGTTEPTTPMAEAPPPGSEVVEVDFGYSTGAIFSVEGQEGEHYAVVWISDEKPDLEAEERIQ